MSTVVPFSFEGAALRVVDREDGPWFVLADVCRVLELGNPSQTASRLDDDERGIISSDTPSAPQQMIIINESGLYSLILTSRKPAARRFKKWITAEVIPSIRKTGRYGAPDPVTLLRDPDKLRELLLSYTNRVLALEASNAVLAPGAAAFERIASAQGSLNLTASAKALQISPRYLIAWLNSYRWIYKRPGGKDWLAYQARIDEGLLEHKVTTIKYATEERIVEQARITPKGLAHLAKRIGRDGRLTP